MNRQQALAALRLKTDSPSPDQVSAAFDRLALRYPRQNFPERAMALESARDILLHPEKIVRALLESDTVNLSWLTPYALDTSSELAETNASLAIVLRPVFMKFEALLPEDNFLASQIGPDMQELLGEGDFDTLMAQFEEMMAGRGD